DDIDEHHGHPDREHDHRTELRADARKPVEWAWNPHDASSRNENPTPCTVWMNRGSCPSSPSLRRIRATWESTTRPPAKSRYPHTRSMSCSRVNTTPGSRARAYRISNSSGVRPTSSP